MEPEPCPKCGSTKRRKMYNKWHIREIYCRECFICLNKEQVRERTRLAEMAAEEGKMDEFYMGTYEPSNNDD